jgi:Tfp pilus assembly protein PilN
VIQQVNLYHPIFRKQEKKFSALTMLQAGVLVLAGILLMYVYAWWQVGSLRTQARQIDADYVATSKRMDDISRQLAARQTDPRLEKQVQKLQARIEAVRQVRQIAKHDYFPAGNGYSNYFIALARQQTAGLWLTGFTVTGAGEQLSLDGRSEQPELVPQYLQKLSSERLLSGTEFEVFRIVRPEAESGKQLASFVDFSIKTASSGKRP